MSTVAVVYHPEAGTWWAESDQLPGFSAAGSTFSEVAKLVREHVRSIFASPVDLLEELDDGSLLLTEDAHLPLGVTFETKRAHSTATASELKVPAGAGAHTA